MIKLVVTGLWVCVITLAAVYFSIQMATTPASGSSGPKPVAQEFVRGESLNVPVIGDGGISGYFITKISYMMNTDKVRDLDLPLPAMMSDALFSALVGNKMVDLSHPKAFNLEAFREQIKKDMNGSLGGDYVARVVVEQLDYLSKDEIRANETAPQKRDMKMTPIAAPEAPAADAVIKPSK